MSIIQQIHKQFLDGTLTCESLISQKLKKAKENKNNSSVLIFDKESISQAKLVDQKIKRIKDGSDEKLLPLEGIPFGAKDTYLLQGTIATGAAPILQNYNSPYTATVIQKCLDDGAILIVKENCDAFGHGSSTENTFRGPTTNALDSSLVAGGSSGGGAVNVASDITVFSIGGDTGGSIRQPAGYNKICGLKVTYGMVSRYGGMSYASSLDTVGPFAKNSEDIAIVLDTIAGKDQQDPTTIAYKPFNESVSFLGMKIGYFKSFLESKGLDPQIKKDFEDTLQKAVDKGAVLEPLDFFDGELLVATYYTIAMAETSSNLSRLDGVRYGERKTKGDTASLEDLYLDSRDQGFSAETKRRIVIGNQVLSQGFADKYYPKALISREQIKDKFQEYFNKVDIIVSPVTPTPVPKTGEVLDDPIAMYMGDVYLGCFSLGGLPTLSVPVGPCTGMQISGPQSQDSKIVKIGTLFEQL